MPSSSSDSQFVNEIRQLFSADGLLNSGNGYEFRAEQQQMAVEIAQALESGTQVIIEAGTGVGKSLAYLVPSIFFAVRNRKKAIISTHTINLQEQLIFKDIPFLQNLLPFEFEAALLKGRQNYCCGTRLERAIQHTAGLFTTTEQKELERIREWSHTTKDGSLSDFIEAPDPSVWTQVCSERNLCTPKTCATNPRCFFQVARKKILSSHVLVLNHTLFFTLIGGLDEPSISKRGFLFPNDFVVFDEAHTLENVASKHIGLGVSQYGLRQSLYRLYNPNTKKGLFQFLKDQHGMTAVTELLPKCNALFDEIASHCKFNNKREHRFYQPPSIDASELNDGIVRLCERAAIVANNIDEENTKLELHDAAQRLRETRLGIQDFLTHNLDGSVYWVEKAGKTDSLFNLHAAPIDLATALQRLLFRKETPCILTSATLSVGTSDLDYFRQRIGADDVKPVIIGSPFNFQKQMQLHLVKQMPDPRDASYESALEKWILHFTEKSNARAFVLFTSYQTMRSVAQRMESIFQSKGWDFYVQGNGMPRNRMVEEFRRSPAGVLFGTESFWTGVDVAGEALSNVIITRLPFATPDHPLIEAKLEAIEESGGNPFQSYSIPEAILKLRQGMGRLIRTKTDRGIVVILDSRIVTKPYGRSFLNALPDCPVEIT